MDEVEASVPGHALSKVEGEAERETGINGAGGFGFVVPDIDGPGWDLVAFGILLRLWSVEENASPGSRVGGLICAELIGRVEEPFILLIC